MCNQRIILSDVEKYYEQFVAVKNFSENSESDVLASSYNKDLARREALKKYPNPKIYFFC